MSNIDQRPSWDEYFMAIANLISLRSGDPVTKVGAVIVKDNKLISAGYNGMPRGLTFTWDKGKDLNNKNLYVVHAEANALLNNTINVEGATMYVTLFPCNECAKLIIQSGIKRLIYLDDAFVSPGSILKAKASRSMLTSAGIELIKYNQRRFKIIEEN